MTDSVAGGAARTNPRGLVAVVLAAGEGRRLRPLTLRRPKPLCPVANVTLLDAALERVLRVTPDVAVNIHHGRDQMEAHLAGRRDLHRSVEEKRALGTAGALGLLRPWIDGRDVLAVNADTWSDSDLGGVVTGWDGERPRLAVAGDPVFGRHARVVATLLPWRQVADLDAEPADLYETTWRPASAAGELDVVGTDAAFFDCGTPRRYLAANLAQVARAGTSILGPRTTVSGTADESVVGAGCDVAGTLRRSVLWDHTEVARSETLEGAIRVSSTMTVLVR